MTQSGHRPDASRPGAGVAFILRVVDLRLNLACYGGGKSEGLEYPEGSSPMPAKNNAVGGHGPESDADKAPVIVAIGASAGGIPALQSFFSGIPQNTGAAFIVVLHLDPEHRSELSAVVAARTKMPVGQVEKTACLEPDHVYVIPPDRRLQVIDQEISATEFDEPRGQRLPIDFLFRSVAERLGDGFAVILSGAGSDGAVGVRTVKEAGGIILVQDPNEADYA